MTTTLLMIGILLAASGQQSQWPTLRRVLQANSIPVGVDDLDRQHCAPAVRVLTLTTDPSWVKYRRPLERL